MIKDIRFCITAGNLYGMGHLRRCLTLASNLIDKNKVRPDTIQFTGNLDAAAIDLLGQTRFADCWVDEDSVEKCSVAIIDRMFDVMDAEYYDSEEIKRITDGACKRLLICSSRTISSSLPIDIAVGYLLQKPLNATFKVFTGLEYSPVDKNILKYRERRREITKNINKCLIAFGNWGNRTGPLKCLQGLLRAQFSGNVKMIVPEAQHASIPQFEEMGRDLNLELVTSVDDIYQDLAEMDLLLGSYGLLTFEAMTIGVPTVIVPIKPFMADYGNMLADKGFIHIASHSINANEEEMYQSFIKIRPENVRLSMRSRCNKIFDGHGLNRLMNLIVELMRDQSDNHERI